MTYLEQGGVEFLSKMKERLGVMVEVADLKDSLWCGEVVFLKVVIQSSIGSAEVRNPSSCNAMQC